MFGCLIKRKRSDLEKHLTIKNCDRTFLKKLNKNRRRFDVAVHENILQVKQKVSNVWILDVQIRFEFVDVKHFKL